MESLPKMNDCENFTQSEAVDYLSNIIEKLKKSKIPFDSSFIHDLIYRLSQSYYDYDNETVDRISEEFIGKDLVPTLSYFFTRITDPLDIKNKTLDLFLTLLINFSNQSQTFASKIGQSKILKIVIDICLTNDNLDNIATKEIHHLIWQCVIVVHNIARDPINRVTHRISEFKKALVKLIRYNDNDKLGVVSMLTLSYLVEENDVELLNEGAKTINNLIGKIKSTLLKDAKCCGYTTLELLHGLMCISANDNMKLEIYEAGGIPILIEIIGRNREKEVESSLGTIENLCFNDYVREKLVSQFDIEAVVKPLEGHLSAAVQKHRDGILWKIHKRAESFHNESKSSEARSDAKSANDLPFDVFISYAWANKSKILEILEYLKRHDIRAWIDKEQMRGSSLEAMARGIENSKLFIVAISPSYKSSANCRHEAEYAFTIKKPMIPVVVELRYKADSWLGFIVGCKVYYEFSERRDVGEVIAELVSDIEHNLRGDSGVDGRVTDAGGRACVADRGKTRPRGAHRAITETWTNVDVLNWLDNANMGHLKVYFRDVDGSLLSVMLEIRESSPEYFNRTLEKQFAMNFIDLMRFHKLLNDLVLV